MSCFALKMLVEVIEQSDSCIDHPSTGPISKLHWVKLALNPFNKILFDQLLKSLRGDDQAAQNQRCCSY